MGVMLIALGVICLIVAGVTCYVIRKWTKESDEECELRSHYNYYQEKYK
jgi:hypothetical protein